MKENKWKLIVVVLNVLAAVCFGIMGIIEIEKISGKLLVGAAICFLISGILSLRLYLKEKAEQDTE